MKDMDLLPKSGNFYKANLHNHCTLSDGRLNKKEIKDEYVKKGYSIVAFTDHNYYEWHKELCDENFIALAAIETNIDQKKVNGGLSNTHKTYHINFYDTNPIAHTDVKLPKVPEYSLEAVNKYIEEMNVLGFMACYCHPWWSLQTYDDYVGLKGLFAMEIYNHAGELDALNGYAPQAYEEMLRANLRICCLATDDNHNKHSMDSSMCDSFGGWVNIKAEALTYDCIVESLKEGNFYSSTGPEIHELYIKDGSVHIVCSPVSNIFLSNETRDTQYVIANKGETVTHASFTLSGNEMYFRIDCEDMYRKHAYTNAYFLDKLR